ncbi:hypothetical protein ACJJTC_006562 [Scirpophaga incertulas]
MTDKRRGTKAAMVGQIRSRLMKYAGFARSAEKSRPGNGSSSTVCAISAQAQASATPKRMPEQLYANQRQVREEETQREKPLDAEASCQGQTVTENDPRRQKRRGKRAGQAHREFLASNTLPRTSDPQPGPSGLGAMKRSRPDETASPSALQGEPKRVRVQSGQGEQRTYALATKDIPSRLAVAICFTPPAQDMTPYQGERVQAEIETPDYGERLVHHIASLQRHVPGIKLPDTDQVLTVMRQSDIPTRVRAALFVPRYNGDIARLQGILKRQNTWYDIGRWSLYRATSVGGE